MNVPVNFYEIKHRKALFQRKILVLNYSSKLERIYLRVFEAIFLIRNVIF